MKQYLKDPNKYGKRFKYLTSMFPKSSVEKKKACGFDISQIRK